MVAKLILRHDCWAMGPNDQRWKSKCCFCPKRDGHLSGEHCAVSCSLSVVLMFESWEDITAESLPGRISVTAGEEHLQEYSLLPHSPCPTPLPTKCSPFSIDVLTSVAGLFLFFRMCFFYLPLRWYKIVILNRHLLMRCKQCFLGDQISLNFPTAAFFLVVWRCCFVLLQSS